MNEDAQALRATRDFLKAEKGKVDLELRRERTAFAEAKGRVAAKGGEYLPPREYHRFQDRISRLAARSQELQRQLGATRPPKELPTVFMRVAEERVAPEEFQAMMDEALRRMDGSA
jgi:hypothetical protein